MDDIKRLGYPTLIILLSALITKLLDTYLRGEFTAMLIKIIVVAALFLFGVSLNNSRKRRNQGAFKKVIAILLLILLLFMQLDFFRFDFMSKFLLFFGVDSFFINMIYIFCGYVFAD